MSPTLGADSLPLNHQGSPSIGYLHLFFLSKFQGSSSYCLVVLSETNYIHSFNEQFLSTQYNKIPTMT